MPFSPESPRKWLDSLPSAERFLVGYSGGLDSTVLLHAMVQLRGSERWLIEAVHVNHHLQSQADLWAEHCQRVCERLAVPLKYIHVDAHPYKGESPEAAARRARYSGLHDLLKPGWYLLTGHQQDDQAETLLLQLLRGSGPAGLAGMPEIAPFGAGWHARPLLNFTRAELVEYAAAHKLQWIEDPSNREVGIDRNFIRHELLAGVRARWPATARTLGRAAKLQAEAAELSDDLARHDVAMSPGFQPGTLSVASLGTLSRARQRNALRHWLDTHGLPIPTRRQLDHVLSDAIESRWDSAPVVTWPGGEVRRYRNDLFAMMPLSEHDPTMVLHWDVREPLTVPHLGITLNPTMIQSLDNVSTSQRLDITVRFRRGGEHCRPNGRKDHHDLKTLFQEAGVPPWRRDRIPLIYWGERLVAVLGYWECE
jgi:tRNA(Ile)-lysidine synthase